MPKQSKIVSIGVDFTLSHPRHDKPGNYCDMITIKVLRLWPNGQTTMFHTSAQSVSDFSVLRAQRAGLALAPKMQRLYPNRNPGGWYVPSLATRTSTTVRQMLANQKDDEAESLTQLSAADGEIAAAESWATEEDRVAAAEAAADLHTYQG